MSSFVDITKRWEFWEDVVEIYEEAFPQWEKEDPKRIRQLIKSGRYTMIVAYEKEIQGFYILDTNETLGYTLFAFLAVKSSLRGNGIGTLLCKNAIQHFQKHLQTDFFLIEAEERQARFYGKLGFLKIDIDYAVPKFNKEGSVFMHLMCIQKRSSLDAQHLKMFIEDIFSFGYGLKRNDPRITAVLAKIPPHISLTPWPPT